MLQVTLAAGLLIVATAFAVSLVRLLRTDLGLRAARVFTFTVDPAKDRFPNPAALRSLVRTVVARLNSGGMAEATAAGWNAAVGSTFSVPVRIDGKQVVSAEFRPVTSGYFAALGVPVFSGRAFSEEDGENSQAVAIVNALFAARYLAGKADGQFVWLGTTTRHPLRIVGVVGNTRQAGPESPAEPLLYVPLTQVPDSLTTEMRQFLALHFFVKTRRDTEQTAAEARRIMRVAGPGQVLSNAGLLSAELAALTEVPRFHARLTGVLALLAIIVANCGLYSIASMSVASRLRELAIEAALGATPFGIARATFVEAARQVIPGLLAGCVLAAFAGRYPRSVITGFVGAGGELAAAVLCLLLLASLAACSGPAWRAARVNPGTILSRD